MLPTIRRLALMAASALAAALLPLAVQAQAYKPLIPLLVDIPQWQAEQADGMNMQAQGQEMVWASRQYRKGDSQLTAVLGIGHPMAAITQMGKVQYEAGGTFYETDTVKGFSVIRMYSKEEKSGVFVVSLTSTTDSPATLIVEFSGLDADEGFSIAKGFDWAAMQKAVKK